MTDDVLHDIPEEYRERFVELLEEPALDPIGLRRDVTVYVHTVKQIGLMVKLLDLTVADRLAASATALLDHLDATPADDELRRVVQAAVRYFVVEEEDEEITGVLGFDDDLQVLNAVSRAAGREDLIVVLDR